MSNQVERVAGVSFLSEVVIRVCSDCHFISTPLHLAKARATIAALLCPRLGSNGIDYSCQRPRPEDEESVQD